jgi:undecaprenyl-diphosphatase
LSYFQAIVIGLLQGVTELFPISSLGHSVLVPAWLGWDHLVAGESADESFYLAFLVGLHVATALVLLAHFWREWVRIIGGFLSMVRRRKADTADERMALLLIIGTIPVGVIGLIFEHSLRTVFAKPVASAIFLSLNSVVLFGAERLRRRGGDRAISSLEPVDAGFVGVAQIGALFAGISRSGISMAAGLLRGLDHEDAAHFSFLLATPIILAAGVYKIPDLLGHNGDGIHGQVLVGSLVAAVAAYGAIRFLERFFRTQNLNPFALYCAAFGLVSVVRFL